MDSRTSNILWVVFIGLIVYLAYNFSPFQEPKSRILSNQGAEVVVKADQLGHYVFSGQINGQRVYFLYDTGASAVAIPDKIARKIGLRRGQQYSTHTANGRAVSYATRLREVRVGDIVMRDVRGAIVPGLKGNQILLGMSFLNHVEISQYKGTLKLRVRK